MKKRKLLLLLLLIPLLTSCVNAFFGIKTFKYDGWHEEVVPVNDPEYYAIIKIPDEWSFKVVDNRLYIYDDLEFIVAAEIFQGVGNTIGSYANDYNQIRDYDLANKSNYRKKTRIDPIDIYIFNDEKNVHYCIYCQIFHVSKGPSSLYYFCLMFIKDIDYAVIEKMACSYVFS